MKNKGFTLIELLVVVSIIGLLSSIVLASLSNSRIRARDTRRIADTRSLQNALQLYSLSNNNRFPNTLALLAPTHISVIPTDPRTGGAYSYAGLGSGTNCSGYHLGITLENTTHRVLLNDADYPTGGTVCTGSAANFAGTDPLYDVRQ